MRETCGQEIPAGVLQSRREMYTAAVEAHYGSVYRFLLLLTHDCCAAEDLTQEVFASAWRAMHRFRGQAAVRTWLHRIAYNAFIDAQRRTRRAMAPDAAMDPPGGDIATDPLSRLMADEHLAHVCQAMENLETGERAVLLLHYMEGCSYREMAKVLGRPSGSVKWLTSRALERLRGLLTGKVEP